MALLNNKPSSVYTIPVIAAICVLAFLCFSGARHNQFTNWDDDVYVSHDTCITSFTGSHLKAIFTQDITKNNFHPLCMLSLAINYHFAKLAPASYYLTNVFIHIANVILVFMLLIMLARGITSNGKQPLFVAGFGALWFAIHPMHVESVCWIAERKDVLYAFFYMAAFIAYIKYAAEQKGRKWYWFSLVLFILSCLSKPMAVTFPLALLAYDYFLLQRKPLFKIIMQKWLFLLVAFIAGAMAVYTQNKTGAIAPFGEIKFNERIMYASYAFVMYTVKLFYPFHLSTFYPYPYRFTSGYLPAIYYASPFIAVAIVAVPLFITWKLNKLYFRIMGFALGFYVANVIFILQFVSVGSAIMADRYTYVAYTGLFFAIAWFIQEAMCNYSPSVKTAVTIVLLALSGWLAHLCYRRTAVWHNAETLLGDAIKKYPYRALLSYKWLGNYYMDEHDTAKALENYHVLDVLNAADAKTYDVLGNIYCGRGDYKKALQEYAASLKAQNNVGITYTDMSAAYAAMGDTANALRVFAVAYRLGGAQSEKRYAGSGFNNVQKKNFAAAYIQYNILLLFNPSNPYYHFYRGAAEYSTGKLQQAIPDFRKAYSVNISDVSPQSAYNLGVTYDVLGHSDSAFIYVDRARKMGWNVEQGYFNKLKAATER